MPARGALLAVTMLMSVMGLMCVIWSFEVSREDAPVALRVTGLGFLVGAVAVWYLATRDRPEA